MTMSLSRTFNIWGSWSTFSMTDTSKLNVNSGGTQMYNGTINGTIITKGNTNSDGNRYAFKLINGSFGAAASVSQTEGGSLRSILGGTITSNAGTGKLSFANIMSFNNELKLTLNSSNAFAAGGAATQGESEFYLMNQTISGDYPNRYETLTASTVDIILNADNDFGKFLFMDGSKLKLTTNGQNVNIGGVAFTEGGSTMSIELYELIDFTVKINDLTNVATTSDDTGKLRANDIMVGDSEGLLDNAYIVQDLTNGGWWINATGAVPEPASIASILGALALGFSIIRRRK